MEFLHANVIFRASKDPIEMNAEYLKSQVLNSKKFVSAVWLQNESLWKETVNIMGDLDIDKGQN